MLPILRIFRKKPLERWKKITKEYRNLAIELGGVLIKLGQFLSIRVDILPLEITKELADLQDEVPPESLEKILLQVENDFKKPISKIFEWFSDTPLGSASLAQVHAAKLKTGEDVVVKILRPGIDVVVETDLASIGLALKWLKLYKPVSKRVDLDWLEEEFSKVTRNELVVDKEAKNAERFANDFQDVSYVYIPKIFLEYCGNRTLTMENVNYIKMGDLKKISSVGISGAQIADKLHDIYMKQIFETNFVHVDPHPGNLFIKPLPTEEEIAKGIIDFRPNDNVPYSKDRPFRIVFVDFGMVAEIPERLRTSIREFAIGIGTRDAHKIVQSYVKGGVLAKGADLIRLEEAHESLFDRFWGIRMGDLKGKGLNEAFAFINEFWDLVYDIPFQFQADMLFIMRAVGILSGMATNLDPNFDPFAKAIPFAEKFAKEDFQQNWQGILQEGYRFGHLLLKFPNHIESILSQTQQGKLNIQMSLAPDSRKHIQKIESGLARLGWMILTSATLVSGVQLYNANPNLIMSKIFFIMSALSFLIGIRKK
ncbi:MAG: AarF/ABC1/UbiB kinase family protein [Desulfobacterales bacterium]|nr:AarF/ABC1/UbiB kinase family protein [Desulfobacterales bacterium]